MCEEHTGMLLREKFGLHEKTALIHHVSGNTELIGIQTRIFQQ